jgi:thiamine pyrophosphate-dependent acetolactate synthase large subunit-like protein
MRQIFGVAAAYDTPPVDFSVWASAFGMPAAIISEPGQLTAEMIRSMLSRGGPALLDVRADADVRIRGGGRVEALQHMSLLSSIPIREERA